MMMIAIDGGTTNTRLTLIRDGEILERRKLRIGARAGSLAEAIRDGLAAMIAEHPGKITMIAASGMITSEAGLYNLSHITAPAGAAELRAGAVTVSLPDVCALPITFIPGVKTFSAPEDLAAMDIMRGEEVEVAGIVDGMGLSGKAVTLILPGSHMKIVSVDEGGRIVDFVTCMSGELSRAAAENTILSRSLDDAFPKEPDPAFLNMGYKAAQTLGGMNAALFKLRVHANFVGGASPEQLYAYLLGVVLHDDIAMILSCARGPVLVGGSNPFRAAYTALLDGKVDDLRTVPEQLAETASARGVWKILGD